MSQILVFGSLNIDYTYKVDHISKGGETLTAQSLTINCGGKGLNQSVAAAKYGGEVYHAGKIGADGEFLKQTLADNGVNTNFVMRSESQTGHAIIQVDSKGQNSIIVYPGSNGEITKEEIDSVLCRFEAGTYLILQNEINNIPYIIHKAYEKGFKIVFNPSPITKEMYEFPLEKIHIFILNETEGRALSGETEAKAIVKKLTELYPLSEILLTLGEKGSVFYNGKDLIEQDIIKTNVVDTTGAGDTVTGYFVAALAEGKSPKEALKIATAAASITVSRNGACASIPKRNELKI